jgi:hypothetical protein
MGQDSILTLDIPWLQRWQSDVAHLSQSTVVPARVSLVQEDSSMHSRASGCPTTKEHLARF